MNIYSCVFYKVCGMADDTAKTQQKSHKKLYNTVITMYYSHKR